MFGVKDPIPGGPRYDSETVKEHLASDRTSHIFKHLRNYEPCRALCFADCFHGLDHASTSNLFCVQ